jgi:hypothetical protein
LDERQVVECAAMWGRYDAARAGAALSGAGEHGRPQEVL